MNDELREIVVLLKELVNQIEDVKQRYEGKMNDLCYEISRLSEGTGTEWQ
tara:strand:+ start:377 stop:526 length:150 start_codon:yes stop_codon:yes gene_type:complete